MGVYKCMATIKRARVRMLHVGFNVCAFYNSWSLKVSFSIVCERMLINEGIFIDAYSMKIVFKKSGWNTKSKFTCKFYQ